VILFLREDLVGEIGLTVNSLCGGIRLDALKGVSHSGYYTQSIMSYSTGMGRMALAERDAKSDLVIKTRDGDITIEKTV
jgi:hypothetical protein